ncbi:hypothetical protein LOK49_LG13G00082 [Camellia lanceoleosa]|uniref:Uncharacterized protein n=1 Tax=Camellia lanceoleosa TaxID=1840588 RepID=A0ACC0FPT4_9ERIC|nr:hypothetical protein LOK49_LG13G00082 [Camellia lanceoleosa]
MHSWSIPPFDCHECYGVEKFEISSIGLTTFEYIGKVKNFSFLDVPRLEKVHIKFMVAYERGTQYMFNGIANDLPRLQNLSLVLTTDEVLPIPARITDSTLSNNWSCLLWYHQTLTFSLLLCS